VNDTLVHTMSVMGTVVTIEVVDAGATASDRAARMAAISRALWWFQEINDRCSRFDPGSELSQLTPRVGTPVVASPVLFQSLQFALAVAADTDGAFDPTVGHKMEQLGFDREYRTGATAQTDIATSATPTYRDVVLDVDAQTVTLLRPLLLDLGAVVKGLAVDLAANELRPYGNFAVNAGGDLFLGGHNVDGAPWSVGIRHPRNAAAIIATVRVSDTAVCTSGDYERRVDEGKAHHLLDPRSGLPADAVASATVIAPSAMVADALATAAFVLGPVDGIAFLERQQVEGLLITPSLDRIVTAGLNLE
jgi:thiamine biosynthesis lipoprotein